MMNNMKKTPMERFILIAEKKLGADDGWMDVRMASNMGLFISSGKI